MGAQGAKAIGHRVLTRTPHLGTQSPKPGRLFDTPSPRGLSTNQPIPTDFDCARSSTLCTTVRRLSYAKGSRHIGPRVRSISKQATAPETDHNNSRSSVRPVSSPFDPMDPDISEWDKRSRTQIVSEKAAATSPYLAGTDRKPRHIRTLRRWRKLVPARGPSFQKIGGRYYYTVGALRDFHQRCIRGDV